MAYATATELTAYATARGYTLIGDLDVLLTKANDWIEAQNYQGYAVGDTAFPRDFVYVNGALIPSDTVPQAIKNAEMAMAIELDKGNDPAATSGRSTKREKIGDLEVEYMDNAVAQSTFNPPMALIKPYLTSGTGYDR